MPDKGINIIKDINGLKYVQFKNLLKYEGQLVHCFTTRIGGVSSGECATLNLGFNRNDSRENVLENYRRVCNALDIDMESLVFSNQVHDKRIKIVDENDRGKGITRESDIIGYDALATNCKNVALVTFYADCVPVLLYDSGKGAIASVHSGWRGTVKKIAANAVRKMAEAYGCNPGKIEAVIGPSIGRCCFEVGEEVYREFVENIEYSADCCVKTGIRKWNVDLQEIIKKTLIYSGLKENNIYLSEICTKCNKDMFFSHRGDNGKTGSLAAIMMLK
ncbi:MAG TPA: peptidoglycan editing factor PgeF [Clostridiaceae bacterium]|nr:peptidoglycan editing factor PgeF [Clostridiaceae bacterium]